MIFVTKTSDQTRQRGINCSKSTDQPGNVANSAQKRFPCPRSCLKIWSRETASAIPSRVSLLILHTPAESGAYLRDSARFPRRCTFIYLFRQSPSGLSRVCIRSRNCIPTAFNAKRSVDTGPVVLKVSSSNGCRLLIFLPWTIFCAPLFPHTTFVQWTCVRYRKYSIGGR